jgi:hypothetical protein
MTVKELAEMPADADFLHSYAARGEPQAVAVAELVSSRDGEFWELACGIVERYPNNTEVRSLLANGIAQYGFVIKGGFGGHYENLVDEIERADNAHCEKRPHARRWLCGLADNFRQQAAAERRQEEDDWIR